MLSEKWDVSISSSKMKHLGKDLSSPHDHKPIKI